jgi:hypothetical protein
MSGPGVVDDGSGDPESLGDPGAEAA